MLSCVKYVRYTTLSSVICVRYTTLSCVKCVRYTVLSCVKGVRYTAWSRCQICTQLYLVLSMSDTELFLLSLKCIRYITFIPCQVYLTHTNVVSCWTVSPQVVDWGAILLHVLAADLQGGTIPHTTEWFQRVSGLPCCGRPCAYVDSCHWRWPLAWQDRTEVSCWPGSVKSHAQTRKTGEIFFLKGDEFEVPKLRTKPLMKDGPLEENDILEDATCSVVLFFPFFLPIWSAAVSCAMSSTLHWVKPGMCWVHQRCLWHHWCPLSLLYWWVACSMAGPLPVERASLNLHCFDLKLECQKVWKAWSKRKKVKEWMNKHIHTFVHARGRKEGRKEWNGKLQW